MKRSGFAEIGSLVTAALLCLSSGCQADTVMIVDKGHIAQMSLASKIDNKTLPSTLVVRYKVLAAIPEESSIVHISLTDKALDVAPDGLSKAQQNLLNLKAIGLIVHYPPARPGASGEVRLSIPQDARSALSQYFVLFRMLPAHPGGKLDHSSLEITSVDLE